MPSFANRPNRLDPRGAAEVSAGGSKQGRASCEPSGPPRRTKPVGFSAWRTLWLAGLVVLVGPLNHPGQAAPWDKLKLFKHVEAKEDADYTVSEENGPWMILAVTFLGNNAMHDARELVYELRKKHKLTAYTHKKRFDFTGQVRGRGLSRHGGPKVMRYQRDKAYDEVAVMVGNYPSVDNSAAQATLKKLKYLWPDCLKNEQGEVSRPLASWRELKRFADRYNKDQDQGKGPLGHAFLVTNPLLPREYYVPKGIDQFVIDLNQGKDYSLLDCKGRYTVKVATFTGRTIIEAPGVKNQQAKFNGEGQLAKAAQRAQDLTIYLRKKGWEAYQFHDRHSSIVTVGSFNSVGNPRPDGKTEINPAIYKIMQTFAPPKPVAGSAARHPRTLTAAKIPLDLQPIPVEVPRRSIARDYDHSLGMR